MNATEHLRSAMRRVGLDYGGEIIADGKLHRFKADDDHARNSWYVLHAGPPSAGAFGCWKRCVKETWCESNVENLPPAERQRIRARWAETEKIRERSEAERHARARKIAAWILQKSKPADGHDYPSRKGVKAHGALREYRGLLVVPLTDAEGTLHSLQLITPDGSKRFLSGGRVAGCFFTLSDRADGPLVICEGVATGASIHEATDHATVCAMNCGNLLAVAKAMCDRWPQRDILIAADNDAFTVGKDGKPTNPGVEKATVAAKASGARLAVPRFNNIASKPTDFNDLHQLEGLEVVKTQIETATPPRESDEEVFERLAKLSPTDYDRCRDAEAKRLGNIRVSTLDAEVAKRRPRSGDISAQGSSVNLPDVNPWPESVDGADTLNEVTALISRYVALPTEAANVVALWCCYCHAFKGFIHSPRLNLFSPEKGCGKTTLLDVIATMTPRALRTENITAAVLFRLVDSHSPTLLLDECDTYLSGNDELRGLLNAGHKRGACAFRCEGENNEVRAFNAFAPAVLAGIGTLPGTLHDRSIVIRLVRAKPSEVAARFDSRRTQAETELCRKLARWAADNFAALETANPTLPTNAFNRLADNWQPLFAVADLVGGDWPRRAADAFAKLTESADLDAQGTGVMLLSDIRLAFAEADVERMFSKTLVEVLSAMTDRPWPEAHRGKPISETWLARRLRAFDVATRTLRIGDERAKGYELATMQEAFDRFLPPATPPTTRDSVTNPEEPSSTTTFQSVTPHPPVTLQKVENPSEIPALSRCDASEPPVSVLVEELV